MPFLSSVRNHCWSLYPTFSKPRSANLTREFPIISCWPLRQIAITTPFCQRESSSIFITRGVGANSGHRSLLCVYPASLSVRRNYSTWYILSKRKKFEIVYRMKCSYPGTFHSKRWYDIYIKVMSRYSKSKARHVFGTDCLSPFECNHRTRRNWADEAKNWAVRAWISSAQSPIWVARNCNSATSFQPLTHVPATRLPEYRDGCMLYGRSAASCVLRNAKQYRLSALFKPPQYLNLFVPSFSSFRSHVHLGPKKGKSPWVYYFCAPAPTTLEGLIMPEHASASTILSLFGVPGGLPTNSWRAPVGRRAPQDY